MKKNKAKFLRRNWLTIVLVIIVFGYFVYNTLHTEQKLKEYEQVKATLYSDIEKLEREVARLADEYAYSQTPEAIEKIAREKLKMVKPNEIIYLIKGLEEQEDAND